MAPIKQGDYVTVTYEGMLADGELFDSTENSGPLTFRIGSNTVLPAFEQALLNMKTGEQKTITIPPEAAYGARQADLIQTFARRIFGAEIVPKPGMVLGLNLDKDGTTHKVPALVTAITEDQVTVDFNHPLAGQVLTYKIIVKDVTDKEPAA